MLKLTELRLAKGLKQQGLAEILGVKNYTVGNWEQGRSEPSIEDLIRLANYFECSIDYLVGREDEFGNIILHQENVPIYTQALSLFSKLPQHKQDVCLEIMRDMLSSQNKR